MLLPDNRSWSIKNDSGTADENLPPANADLQGMLVPVGCDLLYWYLQPISRNAFPYNLLSYDCHFFLTKVTGTINLQIECLQDKMLSTKYGSNSKKNQQLINSAEKLLIQQKKHWMIDGWSEWETSCITANLTNTQLWHSWSKEKWLTQMQELRMGLGLSRKPTILNRPSYRHLKLSRSANSASCISYVKIALSSILRIVITNTFSQIVETINFPKNLMEKWAVLNTKCRYPFCIFRIQHKLFLVPVLAF